MSDRHIHSSDLSSSNPIDPEGRFGRSGSVGTGHGAVSSAAAAAVPMRLRWTPQEIAVGAALGAACGLIFWAFNFA